jgi:excisionase family DNA binding protein
MKARNVRQNDDPLLNNDVESRGARRRQAGQPLRFYTKAEVADMVGVSLRTVQRWAEAGDLAVHRFRGAVRIAEADLKVFFALHRHD